MNANEAFEDEDATVIQLKGFAPVSRITDKMSDATGVLVVDVSNLAHRSAHAYSDLRTSYGLFAGHVYGSLRLLLATMKNHLAPGRWIVALCYDGVEAKADRVAILPTYKGNRIKTFDPVADVHAALSLVPGIHLEHPRREGDDAIAWAAEKMRGPNRPVVVLSGDKDLWALLRLPGVSVYSPNLKRYVAPADIQKRFLTTDPARIPFAKALFGDSSDGIHGIKGLLKDYTVHHLNIPDLTVDSFFASVAGEPFCPEHLTEDKLDESKTRYSRARDLSTRAKLLAARATIELNLRVITADTSGFGPSNVRKGEINPQNRRALEAIMNKFECRTLLDRIGDFFGTEFYVEEPNADE